MKLRQAISQLAVALLLLVWIPFSGSAQKSPTPTLRSSTTLVLIPALVRDPKGNIAYTLSANDFIVTDNDVPQHVTLEETDSQPLSLVVLMQTGGAARTQFAAYRNLDTMLEALVGSVPHHVALVSFDSQPHLLKPFTSHLDELSDELTKPASDAYATGAAIFDAVADALTLLQQEPPNTRRVILLISQPQDDGSKTHREDLIRSIGETNTAIYSLTFSPERQRLKNALTFKEKEHANKPIKVGSCVGCVAYFDLGAPLGLAYNALREDAAAGVADLSGGEHFIFENKHGLEADLGMLTNHIANRYTLSFRPTSNQIGLHALRIRVKEQPTFTVQSRNNYWMSESK